MISLQNVKFYGAENKTQTPQQNSISGKIIIETTWDPLISNNKGMIKHIFILVHL